MSPVNEENWNIEDISVMELVSTCSTAAQEAVFPELPFALCITSVPDIVALLAEPRLHHPVAAHLGKAVGVAAVPTRSVPVLAILHHVVHDA
eukprot:2460632-Rhodomonas_salina.1